MSVLLLYSVHNLRQQKNAPPIGAVRAWIWNQKSCNKRILAYARIASCCVGVFVCPCFWSRWPEAPRCRGPPILHFNPHSPVPSRFMRKIVCRLRLSEVSRQYPERSLYYGKTPTIQSFPVMLQ